ncbi:unnamed protein product [Nippostrongylus brasiliensis]|uniref:Uncharacterized protein n=1 Tax=Nippostrongylus brasiliensis TaxID=27835 RepID=A0A0N4Y5H8_NIPBR|nr:hypothetical protein Q1695_014707 [Nippostrongylus brasiliensis]WKY00070.1 hypothetical protein Q1695_014724 [Nippostrongylus brasiliensis]VDL74844.1 unnamed protein product [Nippostrongylus brasiliensis]
MLADDDGNAERYSPLCQEAPAIEFLPTPHPDVHLVDRESPFSASTLSTLPPPALYADAISFFGSPPPPSQGHHIPNTRKTPVSNSVLHRPSYISRTGYTQHTD